jgi:hypothetical protein
MAYRVYITDDINVVELDVENIDIQTKFELLTLENIGQRKQNIQSINFVGTKTNNNAFGTFFDLSRDSNFSIPNSLLFNYNPLRSVKVLVYENTELVFVGSLRIQEINVDKQNIITYNCVVTSAFIDLKTLIQDRKLEDIDFSDLQHRYSYSVVKNTWNTSIETYNPNNNTYGSKPFKYGSGYVYPYIDYGYFFSSTADIAQYNARNFRPAIYVREYFNRIFSEQGFEYEIKGEPNFNTDVFDRLVLPHTNESLVALKNNVQGVLKQNTGTTWTYFEQFSPTSCKYCLALPNAAYRVPFTTGDFKPVQSVFNIFFQPRPTDTLPNILVKQNIGQTRGRYEYDIDVSIQYQTSSAVGPSNLGLFIIIQKIATPGTPNPNVPLVFEQMAFTTINYGPANTGIKNYKGVLEFDTSFVNGNQIYVTFAFSYLGAFNTPFGTVTFKKSELTIPSAPLDVFSIDGIQISDPDISQANNGATAIFPEPPTNVKQIDFIKSISNLFNWVIYTDKEKPKKIIFETYDSYYSKLSPALLTKLSLDWTNKIDYTKNFKIKTNIDLPKSYLFTFGQDEDFLNADYFRKFREPYSQLEFDDQYGLTEQKKVELIFSPLILAEIGNSNRKFPQLYKVDNGVKKRTKTKPKIGFYNGLKGGSAQWNVSFSTNDTTPTVWEGGRTSYPEVSNYLEINNKVIQDIHYNTPRFIYFKNFTPYSNLPNSYSKYYLNQTSDLTNENVVYIECEALLNSIDIANLDLKIPIYIGTGEFNGAYFKLLKVEYVQDGLPSKLLLQKIGL